MLKQGRALITGATSGIGRAFAELMPRHVSLMLTGRDGDRLDQIKQALKSADRDVSTVAADLTEAEGRDAVVREADVFGADLLINNAGLGAFGRTFDNDPDQERAVTLVNVVATADLTRRIVPGMIERAEMSGRRAGLINLSSTLAFQPLPFMASYAASKMFVLMYTEALAAELQGQAIDVLTLCPGATRTGFGSRAGFGAGNLPGAVEPQVVAREGLNALGRKSIHVVGPITRSVLGPGLFAQHIATRGLGLAIRAATRGAKLLGRP
ncbi:MAG: SDR family NAD(P)-dependent oxidoreductase [Geminicoccaceae bacterium]|nr:SDR family NAD(P)-dependent oxidoreductase [Geminicoccaceae bacterium]